MFLLQLSKDDFDAPVICLGPQVAAILDAVIMLPELSNTSWYAAAFDMIWPEEIREALRVYEGSEPVLVDDISSFVPLVRKVGQFLDGVFFSVPVGQAPTVAVQHLTANGPIEKLVANSIVQVCAFDTSWIEIGTDSQAIIDRVQGRFGGKIAPSMTNA